MKVKSLSRVRLLTTPWTAAYQAPPSMGFSRQEYWSGVPLPSPMHEIEMEDDKFNNIEDMINEFSKLDIEYDKSNYFIKKAQIILNGKGGINVCR